MNDRNNDRIDEADQRILALLQQNSAATIHSIAAVIGLSASTVHERIRKLEARASDGRTSAAAAGFVPEGTGEKAGQAPVILAYEARLDPAALGLGLLAFVFVRADERVGVGEAGRCLAAIPEVQEVHHIAGEDCYLVKLRTHDTASLGRLLRERFAAIPAIRSTRTTIVLDTIKETARLPIAVDSLAGESATAPTASPVDLVEDGGAPAPLTHTGVPAVSSRRSRKSARTAPHTITHTARRRESK